MINKTEFKGRIVAMFQKMDSNSDSSLNDKEINKMKRYHYGKMKNKTGGYKQLACLHWPLPITSSYSSLTKSSDAELMQ